MNLVTVVIPVYNGGDRLAACLESPGLHPGGRQAKVVVVDNGSTDGSAATAARLGASVMAASRPGQAAARNVGLYAADTPFVAFLDADGVAGEGWLEHLIGAVGRHAGAGGLINWESSSSVTREFYRTNYPTNETCCSRGSNPYVLTSNAIFRRDVLMNVGGFDPRMRWCEDLELGLRLARAGWTFGYASQAVVALEAPHALIDGFAQFYKYGVGLDQTLERHPNLLDWEPWEEFKALVRDGVERWNVWSFVSHLGYLTGWVDARTRRAIRGAFPRGPLLPIMHRLPKGRGGPPAVALSIDDGPSSVCERVLQLLARHGARATFFVTGERAALRADMIREITRNGHEVFPHGWSHRRLDLLSPEEIQNEMGRTEALLKQIRPAPLHYFVRLPYGAGWDDPYVHQALWQWNSACSIAHWTVSIRDWEFAWTDVSPLNFDATFRQVSSRLSEINDLAGSILLLHDWPYGSGNPSIGELTLATLESSLRELSDRGYQIKSIGEML